MFSLLGSVIQDITNFFKGLTAEGSLSLDGLFYLALAVEVILFAFFIVKSLFSYESRLTRAVNGLNKWLYSNQYINEGNLLELNDRIKKAPKLLRYHWQQFMLYREKEPSYYMSVYNCIEKPLKASSFRENIKNYRGLSLAFVILFFTLALASQAISYSFTPEIVVKSLVIPVFVLFLDMFFLMFFRARRNANLSDLYQSFHLFQRFIDKACTTLPEYVDFEVLFTKQEIKKGIPVLNEYLEKRARQEKEELEKARLNAVEHEKYDFAQAGIDGAQVLERALKESETYLNIKQRLEQEMTQLDSQIETFKKNYDNTQKEYQRKMQASKENLERLREQQEATTNRIETNYIKKQQTDEIKKQEQLEKEYDDATVRFSQEVTALQEEIDKRKAELEERRKYVESAMYSEYQTFSNKLYDDVSIEVEKKNEEYQNSIINKKDELEKLVERLNNKIEALEVENEKLREGYKNPEVNVNEDKTETQNNQTQEGYYDEEGYYRYPNGAYYDPQGIYHDEKGGWYDNNGNYHPAEGTKIDTTNIDEIKESLKKAENKEQELEIKEEVKEEQTSEPIEASEISQDTLEEPIKESVAKEPVKEESSEEIVYDEYGGYTDSQGYYRYKNGSYYDPDGFFHDEEGNIYDSEGNLVEAKKQESGSEPVQTQEKKRGRPKKETSEDVEKPKKKVGRPKKETNEVKEKKPVGRPKKQKSEEDKVKRPVGRPKKNKEGIVKDLQGINEQIVEENKKLAERRDDLSSSINETLTDFDKADFDNKEAIKLETLKTLQDKADELMKKAQEAKDNNADSGELDKINKDLEALITELNKYKETN